MWEGADMDEKSLERLERIARNLPIYPGTLHQGMVDTGDGRVYIAMGRGVGSEYPPVAWHGVYAIEYGHAKGFARLGEAHGKLTLKQAQRYFLRDATFFIEEFKKREMNDESYRMGKDYGAKT